MRTTPGIGLLGALLGILAGCTTYVEPPVHPTVYVPAPPVYVEPPRVSVAPPPVYVAPPAGAAIAVEIHTENDFYEPLSPYGRWEVIAPYGRCWIPSRVAADW